MVLNKDHVEPEAKPNQRKPAPDRMLWYRASFSTINVDQRGSKTGSERTVVVNCEPYPESPIHHGRHKTKSGGFSNSSDNVLSVFVYLFDKHISLIDTCLSYIYCYNIGPVKKLVLHFFAYEKNS